MQQLQVRENVVGFEKALGAVKVIKDQIQYRSQSLLNLARNYFIHTDLKKETFKGKTTVGNTIMIHLHKNPLFFIKSNNSICSRTKHMYSQIH